MSSRSRRMAVVVRPGLAGPAPSSMAPIAPDDRTRGLPGRARRARMPVHPGTLGRAPADPPVPRAWPRTRRPDRRCTRPLLGRFRLPNSPPADIVAERRPPDEAVDARPTGHRGRPGGRCRGASRRRGRRACHTASGITASASAVAQARGAGARPLRAGVAVTAIARLSTERHRQGSVTAAGLEDRGVDRRIRERIDEPPQHRRHQRRHVAADDEHDRPRSVAAEAGVDAGERALEGAGVVDAARAAGIGRASRRAPTTTTTSSTTPPTASMACSSIGTPSIGSASLSRPNRDDRPPASTIAPRSSIGRSAGGGRRAAPSGPGRGPPGSGAGSRAGRGPRGSP